jgi:hypothetical protein
MLWRNLTLLAALAIAGCSDSPERGAVEGVLTLDGQPVASALVIFAPEQPGVKQSMGVTDAEGRFKLNAADSPDGPVVGVHRVVIQGATQFATARPPPVKKPTRPFRSPMHRLPRYRNGTRSSIPRRCDTLSCLESSMWPWR